jgi:hypothetical protein
MSAQNANLPAERKPQVVAGAPVAALVPQNLEEAFRLAGAIAASALAPRGLDKPEQIMVAIMAGAELGLAPFQSLQSFAVVNGRPTLWGDGLVAVVRARGVRIKEWIEGEGDAMVAHCEVTRPDTGETIPGEFSVADAKKASLWGKQGPWQQYPRRMLKARARAFALRDGCADMLRGIQVREEVEDYDPAPRPAQAVETTGMRARLEGRQKAGGFDAGHVARQLDAASDVIDGEFEEAQTEPTVTDEEADAGAQAAGEAAQDDFPGDRSSTPAEPAKTASDRPGVLEGMKTGRDVLNEQEGAAAMEDIGGRQKVWNAVTADLDAAESMDATDEIWRRASDFRDWLKANAPVRHKALQDRFNTRQEALS